MTPDEQALRIALEVFGMEDSVESGSKYAAGDTEVIEYARRLLAEQLATIRGEPGAGRREFLVTDDAAIARAVERIKELEAQLEAEKAENARLMLAFETETKELEAERSNYATLQAIFLKDEETLVAERKANDLIAQERDAFQTSMERERKAREEVEQLPAYKMFMDCGMAIQRAERAEAELARLNFVDNAYRMAMKAGSEARAELAAANVEVLAWMKCAAKLKEELTAERKANDLIAEEREAYRVGMERERKARETIEAHNRLLTDQTLRSVARAEAAERNLGEYVNGSEETLAGKLYDERTARERVESLHKGLMQEVETRLAAEHKALKATLLEMLTAVELDPDSEPAPDIKPKR